MLRQCKLSYAFFVLALTLATGALAYRASWGAAKLYHVVFPDVAILKTQYPVAVRKDGSRILYRFQKQRPANWLSLRQIPKQVVAAVLMSEDGNFFQHRGYDPEAIRAAWEYNRKPGVKIKRGGSTITQQVVKNLFLSPEKTMTRKLRELLLAVDLERKASKVRILETYLNIAEWGPGTFGLAQAAERYFKKPVSTLSAREGAILAFMLPNPNKYQHSLRDDGLSSFATKRVEVILERLWKTGHISDEEYTSAGSPSRPSNL